MKTLKNKTFTVLIVIIISFYFFLAIGIGTASGFVVAFSYNTPEFNPNEIKSSLPSTIKCRDGNTITTLDREHRRKEITMKEIPWDVKQAFIAIEDSRFYEHQGVDLRAITRAAVNNFEETGNPLQGSQGGSTITQQLVKNTLLSPMNDLERKVQEARLALELENYYSKNKILELYLNYATYFDHNNYGIEAASNFYFSKNTKDLNYEEAALLAGIIRRPSKLSPLENPKRAKNRQITVLNTMRKEGFISLNEYNKAASKDLEELLDPKLKEGRKNSYFVDYVINNAVKPILKDLISSGELPGKEDNIENIEELLYFHGLTIHTTKDINFQKHAENILNDPDNYPENWKDENGVLQPQGALVVSDPRTGQIKALVGGRDYGLHNMYNRALSTRSPGSAMKPINVYTPAMEKDLITPGTVIDDAPTEFLMPGENYTPENYTRTFTGLTTVRDCLVNSLNVPTVKIYNNILDREIGLNYASEFGISTFTDSDKENPAAAVGGLERGVKPIELNQAYATLANEGTKVDQHVITKIEDRDGNTIYENNLQAQEVISRETAWLINDILKDVISVGTAASLELNFPAAAKTGTSNNLRDAWLVGYTPKLTATFWLGYDRDNIQVDNRTNYTTRVIEDIMTFKLNDKDNPEFEKPESIVGPITISTKSGKRPSKETPSIYISTEYFPQNKIPSEQCDIFVKKEVCTRPNSEEKSKVLASKDCPEEFIESKVFLDRDSPGVTDGRWEGGAGRSTSDASLMPPEKECNLEKEEN